MSSDASSSPPVTIGELRRMVARHLRAAFDGTGGHGTPDLDARLLVAEAAGLDAGAPVARDTTPAGEDTVERALAFAVRRGMGEPVARIVGHKEFWSLDLALSPATLIPRPDTETVVEAALAFLRQGGRRSDPAILDLGTGSGAILLALLSELPRATGVGSDRSREAATTARNNARRLGLAPRAAFVVGDWLAPFGGPFDAIVANPPYIPAPDIAGLDVEVRAHDPRLALDGGGDGLDAVRAILGDLRRVLAPGGAAFIEIGAGQGEGVAGLAAAAAGWSVRFVRDLQGIDRVAVLGR